MARRLSLRARLVVGVTVLAAVGLLAADVATYAALLFMGVLGSQRLLWRRKPQFGAAGSPGGHHL